MVTIINLSSLVGAFVIPFSNKPFYRKLLMFLIALAVGTLAGSGFIHLIPEVSVKLIFTPELERDFENISNIGTWYC